MLETPGPSQPITTNQTSGSSRCNLADVLIDVPGEINEGSFGEPTEIEKQDKEMIERWKDEADTNLVFVCAGSTIVYIITF